MIGVRLFIVLAILVQGKIAFSQYYSTGQEAASIRWKQIKTEHVKLIFPDYYESRARQLVSYLDTVYKYANNSLNYYPKRIPVIMHTQSATSNAVVAWAPKRMEFYTTPPQDMYAQPWLEQLSLHEYRHVGQIEKLNQGPTKVISCLFGQQGTAAILGLYVPIWFMEGDAVVTETGLSHSGRGRVPLFEMNLRTQVLERGPYKYDKAILGSYRDFIPNQYELGYFLVAEGRRNYGTQLWEHSLNRVARRPYMVTPFQKGIRDISGKRKLPFYAECMSGLEERWKVQDSLTNIDQAVRISPASKHYTNYNHPRFISADEILALKSSIDDIPRFVKIDSAGNEEVIFTPGFLKSETISYAESKICWVETRPDLRWSNRSNTVIRIYDVSSSKVQTLNNGLRLFAPALNQDGTNIIAVHVDSLDHYTMVLLDALNGEIQHKIPMPADVFPLTPVWAGDDQIIAVLVSENGKSLTKFDLGSGRSTMLLEWDFTEFSQPYYHAPYVYITAAWSGISNIYAFHLDDGSIHKVSAARFGAVDACISDDGSAMVYADYASEGSRIVKLKLDPKNWMRLEEVQDHSIGLYKSIAAQEIVVPPWSAVDTSADQGKKYSKIGNLFNFHSWAPLSINASTYSIHPGVSIMSQNLLSSSFLSAGYSYNVNEQAGKIYGTYTYAGWFPIIDLGVDYGLRRDYAYLPEKTEVKWDETNLRAGVRLPLNFRRGKYYAGMQLSVYGNQGFRRMKKGIPVEFRKPDIFSSGYSFSIYRQIKSNFRDIFPRWGQSVALYYRHTPFLGDNNSYIAAATLGLYFPGLFRHQGLNVYAGYQQREIGYYKFSDIVPYPRGVSGKQDQELLSLRGTYAFPIAYPDWSIGPVIYMKRIRANLFYDHSFGWIGNNLRQYSSVGTDLLAEIHILRFVAPFELGVRAAYLPEDESMYWGFLMSIGFSSFYVSGSGGEPKLY